MNPLLVGSDAWTGAVHLEGSGSQLEQEVICCNEETKWDNLLALCTNLRGGIKCSLSKKCSIGTQNLVKLVEFEDGMKWVARVSLKDVDHRMNCSKEEEVNNQIATYRFLKYFYLTIRGRTSCRFAEEVQATHEHSSTRSSRVQCPSH